MQLPSTYYRLSLEVGRVSEIAYESVNIGQFSVLCMIDVAGRLLLAEKRLPHEFVRRWLLDDDMEFIA
jgi:hypothetical protein